MSLNSLKYYISVGRHCPTDAMMRLSRGGIEARDYKIDSVPWKILDALHSSGWGLIDSDIGDFIWYNFPSDFEDTSG